MLSVENKPIKLYVVMPNVVTLSVVNEITFNIRNFFKISDNGKIILEQIF
jgi:hypothetical protein